jgi:hypothetical protein
VNKKKLTSDVHRAFSDRDRSRRAESFAKPFMMIDDEFLF